MNVGWSAKRTARLLAEGDARRAESECRRRCAETEGDAEAWFLLGAALHRLGRQEEALAAFDRAIELDPRDVRAYSAAGALAAARGQASVALGRFEAALALRPRDPRLNVNAGMALEALGRPLEALERYTRALEAFPGMGDALLNRTALNLALGRTEAARADADRLAALFPDLPQAWFNRAEAALARGDFAAALADCERALALDARFVKAWIEKGIVLAALGRLEEAETSFGRARALDADAVATFRNPLTSRLPADGEALDARRIWLHVFWQRQRACDWTDREQGVARAKALIEESAGTEEALRDRALMFPCTVLPFTARTCRLLADDVAAEVCRNARAAGAPPPASARGGDRIRVGYLSPNFRTHPSAFLTRRLYALHDRHRFEVYAYSLHEQDDPLRREIAASCDAFRDLSTMTDTQAAACIRADGVHVLVDLAGYYVHARPEILALRPAPVRVGYLGFPGTLGEGILDYRITDAITTPEALAGEFAEHLVRLPVPFFLCDEAYTPAPPPPRESCGLPPEGFVYCAIHNAYKLEPCSFDIWMRLLRATPGAVLWLLDEAAERLRSEAAARGVDPARLVFAPRVARHRHLQRLAAADLYLDTFTCNAHATAVDALLAGLPVLTRPGARMASRIGASLVTAAGLPELVAAGDLEYARTAVELARDRDRLTALRRRLTRRGGPLFATGARVRALERAFETMWDRHRRGLPPVSFDVD